VVSAETRDGAPIGIDEPDDRGLRGSRHTAGCRDTGASRDSAGSRDTGDTGDTDCVTRRLRRSLLPPTPLSLRRWRYQRADRRPDARRRNS